MVYDGVACTPPTPHALRLMYTYQASRISQPQLSEEHKRNIAETMRKRWKDSAFRNE